MTAKHRQWLITGGCGFIGRNLVRRILRETSDRIRIFDNESVGTRDELFAALQDLPGDHSARLDCMRGDVREQTPLIDAARDCDAIVHLAANTGVPASVEDPLADCTTNVLGTLHCLEAARTHHVTHFVFASSGAATGECTPPVHEEVVPHPCSPYGASKLAGEGYCSVYWHLHNIRTVVLRFGNVYGPYSSHKSSVVAKFIRQALQGIPCEIYGDGTQTRDFIYVEDLTSAVLKASELDHGGEIFQIATSKEHTVNEVAEYIKQELAARGKEMVIRHTRPRKGDIQRNYSDTSKANCALNWQSTVAIAKGMGITTQSWIQAKQGPSRTTPGQGNDR